MAPPRSRWLRWAAASLLCLVHLALGAAQLPDHGPAVDEPLHILSSHALWTSGEMVDPTHPPLARYLMGLPLVLVGSQAEPLHAVPVGSRHDGAQHFLVHNRVPKERMLSVARAVGLLLSLAVLLLSWRWARRLWGEGGGLLALALLAFSPLLLADAPIAGNDVACALGFLLAVTSFGAYLRRPTRRALLLFCLAFFAAQAAKFSSVLLVPICLALYLVKRWQERRGESPVTAPRPGLLARDALLVAAGTLLFLWASYRFEISSVAEDPQIAAHPRRQEIQAQLAERVPPWLVSLPVPLYSFWKGLAVQGFHAGNQATWTAGYNHQFLLGANSPDGWWYYFPAAMGVKTPLPVLLLGLSLVLGWLLRRRSRQPEALVADRFELALLVVPVLLWLAFCALLTINIGIRYVLPIYPLLYIGLGAAWPLTLRLSPALRPASRAALGLLCLWQAAGTVRAAPHVHAYFNELAGGSGGGWSTLNNSSIDWGQDLPLLSRYLSDSGISNPYLDYFGSAEPADWGIDRYRLLPTDPQELAQLRGVVVVSQTHLTAQGVREPLYRRLRAQQPIVQLGGSIFVYRL